MSTLLYEVVMRIARIHNYIMRWNDGFERSFTDKELHFLVIGLLGIGLVLVIQPLFVWLARHHHELIITWIYVFTILVVVTFAIEIGQKLTGTGNMEFADIMFGLFGFLFMFIIYALIRGIILGIVFILKKNGRSRKDKEDRDYRSYDRDRGRRNYDESDRRAARRDYEDEPDRRTVRRDYEDELDRRTRYDKDSESTSFRRK